VSITQQHRNRTICSIADRQVQMAIMVNIDGNDSVRFLSNGQGRSLRQISGTVAEECENTGAMLAVAATSGHGKRHVHESVLIEVPNGYVAF
jgi:hypothetical protein